MAKRLKRAKEAYLPRPDNATLRVILLYVRALPIHEVLAWMSSAVVDTVESLTCSLPASASAAASFSTACVRSRTAACWLRFRAERSDSSRGFCADPDQWCTRQDKDAKNSLPTKKPNKPQFRQNPTTRQPPPLSYLQLQGQARRPLPLHPQALPRPRRLPSVPPALFLRRSQLGRRRLRRLLPRLLRGLCRSGYGARLRFLSRRRCSLPRAAGFSLGGLEPGSQGRGCVLRGAWNKILSRKTFTTRWVVSKREYFQVFMLNDS